MEEGVGRTMVEERRKGRRSRRRDRGKVEEVEGGEGRVMRYQITPAWRCIDGPV